MMSRVAVVLVDDSTEVCKDIKICIFYRSRKLQDLVSKLQGAVLKIQEMISCKRSWDFHYLPFLSKIVS